jgi:hypothetical protein
MLSLENPAENLHRTPGGAGEFRPLRYRDNIGPLAPITELVKAAQCFVRRSW